MLGNVIYWLGVFCIGFCISVVVLGFLFGFTATLLWIMAVLWAIIATLIVIFG